MANGVIPYPDWNYQNVEKITVVRAEGMRHEEGYNNTFFFFFLNLHCLYCEVTVSDQLQMKNHTTTHQKPPEREEDCIILIYSEHLKGPKYPESALYSSVSIL